MKDAASTGGCLDAETLAAFAEGKTPRAQMAPLLAHLERCARCMRGLEQANAMVEPQTRSQRWWLVAAAVVVLAIAAAPLLNVLRPQAPTGKLVALSKGMPRSVEPRLSGGFAWAPYHGPAGANDGRINTQRMQLIGAAGEIVARADREPGAETQHAAGVALVLIESSLDAMDRLRAAATLDPNNARAWSDLGAAQYAAAMRHDRPSLYPEALASVDRALRIDEALPEALFNRALILERLALARQARDAWQRYLDADPSSKWAEEARQRMAALPSVTENELFRELLPKIEEAALAGDARAVERLVDRCRQNARVYAEAETLGRWADAYRSGDVHEAERRLAIAEHVGAAVAHLSGESLLRESVLAIRRADFRRRATIAEAHSVYRRARIAYSKQQLDVARDDLLRSAALFASAESPMALVARFYAASVRFDQSDVAGARAELEALRGSASKHPHFVHVTAKTDWQLALCFMVDDDWSGALPHVAAAESAFRRLGETGDEGFLSALLGDTLICLNRLDEGWTSRIRSFALLSRSGRGDRLPVSLGGAARMELRHGRFASAQSLLRLETDSIRVAGNDVLLANALAREAVLSTELSDARAAAERVREAAAVASRIADPALRARAMTDVHFAAGASLLQADAREARARLTHAIDGYRKQGLSHFLPECHLLRARTELRLGDAPAAAADLEEGIAALERHRIQHAGAVIGTGVFRAGIALFHEAVALALDRGDVAAAFDYAERAHGNTGRGVLASLQRHLAGSDALVLKIVASREEVIALAVSAREVQVSRQPGAALSYETLIRPFEKQIARAGTLIVVPDPRMRHVAFAALYDARAKKYLVEKLPVAGAPSAAALRVEHDARTPRRVVTAALRGGRPLPAIEQETAEVRGFYAEPHELESATFAAFVDAAEHADVIHVAGHTEARSGAGEAALVFSDQQRVSWRDVAGARLDSGAVVVLAACETLRRPASPETFALSLGDGFLAAGASEVIGTLDPVTDNEARALFRIVHRELAAGATAAEAVRRAQLESIHKGDAWRSFAVATNTIPR